MDLCEKYPLQLTVLLLLHSMLFSEAVRSDIRLSGGPTGAVGRLEVFDGSRWGTVCDDGDGWRTYCALVCHDLGYPTGRQATTQEKNSMGRCEDLPILWDDVMCPSSVTSVFDCQRNPGPSNCNHDEDVHCVCQGQAPGPSNPVPPPSSGVDTCDMSRHKITPYDPNYPWIGRAEVTSQDGSTTYAICDDFWDDEDAQVFCKCFSGARTSTTGYRAFWKTSYSNMAPISMKYKAVHCTKEQAQGAKRNIFHCNVIEAGASSCDVMKEAAGVACGPIPTHLPTPPPIVTVTCSTQFESKMKICFESSDSSYTLNPAYLEHQPQCADITTSQASTTSGFSKVCMEINMDTCMTSKAHTSASQKTYCYDVRYSQYDRYPGVMMTDTVWNRRGCCEVLKNRTVSANFLARDTRMIEPEETINSAVNDLPFRIDCYRDESFSGPPLSFPANVTRGQDLFCKVTVSTWDERLFLVVPTCRFAATEFGTPYYEFWAKNCPQTSAMPVSYYNLGPHTWGLQFTVPLFQNYHSLFLTCGSYVCDRDLDAKPYCDRSCSAPYVPVGRKKRSAHAQSGTHKEVHSGELRIQDTGFGPLIMRNGTVIDIEAQTINVKVGKEVRHVTFKDLEFLPQQPPLTPARHHQTTHQVHRHDDETKHVTSPHSAGKSCRFWSTILVLPLVVLVRLVQ